MPPATLGSKIKDMIARTRGPRAVMAVARDAGVSYSYLNELIRDEKKNPTHQTLTAICAACGATPEDLYGGAPKKSRKKIPESP